MGGYNDRGTSRPGTGRLPAGRTGPGKSGAAGGRSATRPTPKADRKAPERPAAAWAGTYLGFRRVSMVIWFLVVVLAGVLALRLYQVRSWSTGEPLRAAAPDLPARRPVEPPRPPVAQVPEPEDEAPAPPAVPMPEPASPAPAEAESPAEDEAGDTRIVELVLAPGRTGGYYAEGQINRQKATFIVDTGASVVAVPEKLRWKLKLSRGRYIRGATAAGETTMYETRIENLTVGPLHFKNVEAVLIPGSPDDVVLLGMSALRQTRMSYQQGRLTLQQEVPVEDIEKAAAAKRPPKPVKFQHSVEECMASGKVIDAKVLRCMQGKPEGGEAAEGEGKQEPKPASVEVPG
jgi:aspartyl protease family protein